MLDCIKSILYNMVLRYKQTNFVLLKYQVPQKLWWQVQSQRVPFIIVSAEVCLDKTSSIKL